MSPTVTEVIQHCQKQIKKEPPEDKLLHYIGRLKRLRIHIHDLVDTGIGRTINQLSRVEGPVGEEAWSLVQHWKAVVEAERSADSTNESESGESSSNEDDDEDVPVVPAHSQQHPDSVHAQVRSQAVTSSLTDFPSSRDRSRSDGEDVESDSEGSDRLCIDDKPEKITAARVDTERRVSSSSSSSSSSGSSSSDSEIEPTDPIPKLKQKQVEDGRNGADEFHGVVKAVSPTSPVSPTTLHSPSKSKSDRHHSPSKSKSGHDHSPSKSKSDRQHSLSKSESSRHRSPANTDSHRHHSSTDSARHQSPAKRDSKKDSDRHHSTSSHRKHDQHKGSSGQRKQEHESKSSSAHSHKSSSSGENKEKVKDHGTDGRESSQRPSKERDFKVEKPSRVAHVKKEPVELGSLNGASNIKVESSSKVKVEEKSRKDRKKARDHERKNDSKRKADTVEEKLLTKKIKLEKEDMAAPTKEKKVSNSLKPKLLPRLNVEIDSTSGVNFADVLGGLDSKKLTKHKGGSKKADKESSKPKKSSIILPPQKSVNGLVTPNVEISPYYKPNSSAAAFTSKASSSGSRAAALTEEPAYKAKIQQALSESLNDSKYWEDSRLALGAESYQSEGDALSKMITSRNQRSKVYSGLKSGFVGKIPSLFDLCLRVIQDNIDDLGFTGGVPFEILEPALTKTTPTQLIQIENYNPYLLGSTDKLWKFHCQRDFRGNSPQELESWRELYMRSVDERNARLESLTNKFKNQQDVAAPVRKTKLAYVDTSAGPKFSKTKAATIKSGMSSLKTREEKGSKRGHGSSASSGGGGNNNQDNIVVEEASVIINGKSRRAGPSSASNPAIAAVVAKQKPKKAPLMQKTLKSMKTLLRR